MFRTKFLIATIVVVFIMGYLFVEQKQEVIVSKNENILANLGFEDEQIINLLDKESSVKAKTKIEKINELYKKITDEVGFKEIAINRQIENTNSLDEIITVLDKYYQDNKEKYTKLTDANAKLIAENNLDFKDSEYESLIERYLRQQYILILNEVPGVETNIKYENILVANKSHSLDQDYVSPDTEKRKEMEQKMLDDAAADGVIITELSSYRSYEYQRQLFNGYVAEMGHDAAASLSAIPGTSEHQTGLTADFGASDGRCTLESCYASTKEGKWLKENAYKYGFILRYQLGKDQITGYNFEPWHYRYVGVDIATEMYNNDPEMTLEEYLGIDYPIYTDNEEK